MKPITGIAIFIALLMVGSCASSKKEDTPFVGYWQSENYGETDCFAFCELRIDFSGADSVMNAHNYMGTIYAYESMLMGDFAALDTIISCKKGSTDNEMLIEYRHQETGEIWAAKLIYHPESQRMTFINGKMLKLGPNSPKEDDPVIASDFEGVHWIEPDTASLSFISKDPRHPQLDPPSVGTVVDEVDVIEEGQSSSSVQLEDRLIYQQIDAQGERHLMCRYNNSEDAVTIVDMQGESPLSSTTNVVNAWASVNAKGALLVVLESGREYDQLYLLKIDEDNRPHLIDTALGLSRSNQVVEDPTEDMFPSITKENERIVVYSPSEGDPITRIYDLDGVAVK